MTSICLLVGVGSRQEAAAGVGVCSMPDNKARRFDQARTRAIAAYVQEARDALEKAIEDFHKLDNNAKRNELLRLGRKRFYEESADIQDQCIKKHLGVSGETNQGVQVCGGARRVPLSGGAANEHEKQPQELGCVSPSPKEPAVSACAESAPKHAKNSAAQAPSQGVVASGRGGVVASGCGGARGEQGHQQLIKHKIYATHSMLANIFGDEQAADVLASSFRFWKGMRPFLKHGDITVEAAAILGLAIKHILTLGQDEEDKVRQVWEKMAGTASILAVRERELRLINAWGSANQ